MNYKNLLSLLAISAAASPMLAPLLTATKAEAAEAIKIAQASCDAPMPSNRQSSILSNRGILIASSAGSARNDSGTDFSEAESDAAVALFGCDCPACIRSLKQLQRQSLTQKVLGNSSQGHCWTALQKRASPQVVKEVLKNLESQKIN